MIRTILRHPLSRAACWYLALFMGGFLAIPPLASAAFLPSTPAVGAANEAGVSEGDVQKVLEEGFLAERLSVLGLSHEEVAERISALSDDERQAVMADIERLQAGGDAVGSLVSLAILVLLIIIILKLLNKEIVIK